MTIRKRSNACDANILDSVGRVTLGYNENSCCMLFRFEILLRDIYNIYILLRSAVFIGQLSRAPMYVRLFYHHVVTNKVVVYPVINYMHLINIQTDGVVRFNNPCLTKIRF